MRRSTRSVNARNGEGNALSALLSNKPLQAHTISVMSTSHHPIGLMRFSLWTWKTDKNRPDLRKGVKTNTATPKEAARTPGLHPLNTGERMQSSMFLVTRHYTMLVSFIQCLCRSQKTLLSEHCYLLFECVSVMERNYDGLHEEGNTSVTAKTREALRLQQKQEKHSDHNENEGNTPITTQTSKTTPPSQHAHTTYQHQTKSEKTTTN